MALSVVEAVAETLSTTNAATYNGSAFTPATGDLLVALVSFTGNTASAPTMTGGGWTWTRQAGTTFNTTDSIHVFTAKTTGTTSTTPSVATNNGNATGCAINVHRWSGTNVQPKQSDAEARTAANPVVTMPAALSTGNGYSAAFAMPRNPPTSTPPGSWTETADGGYTSPAAGFSAAYRNGGETGSTITFTSASAAYGIVAVEVYEAPITGTLAKTTDDSSLSATATVAIVGSAAPSTDASTLSATATLAVTATLSTSTEDSTVDADGTVEDSGVAGTLSVTTDDSSLSAQLVVSIVASFSGTTSDATVSSDVDVAVVGTLSTTTSDSAVSGTASVLAAAVLSASTDTVGFTAQAVVAIVATASPTTDDSSLVAFIGQPPILCTLSATTESSTVAGSGEALVTAQLAVTTADSTLVAEGFISAGIAGSLTVTLDDVLLVGGVELTVRASLQVTLEDATSEREVQSDPAAIIVPATYQAQLNATQGVAAIVTLQVGGGITSDVLAAEITDGSD